MLMVTFTYYPNGYDPECQRDRSIPEHKVTYQGKLLKWQYPEYHPRKPCHSKRGEITYFSEDSRFRMISLMNTVDWSRIGKSLFITLTYPNFRRPECKEEMNVQRALLARYIENRMQRDVSILWRIEWQGRKEGCMRNFLYPHIHLILFNVTYLHFSMVNRWWKTIIGVPPTSYVRTETKRAYGERGVWSYLSGYVAKNGSLVIGPYLNNAFPGRQWGLLRRESLPVHDRHFARIPDGKFIQGVYSHAVGNVPRNKYGNKSFTIFGPKAEECGDALFGVHLDGEIDNV